MLGTVTDLGVQLDVISPLAGVPFWLSPIIACVIAFFSSMGGVSGAFLLLPFQISILGLDGPAVSATNHLYNIVAIPGGVLRYLREGRLLWPLAGVLATGTLPGAMAGVWVRVVWLPDGTRFRLFVGLVLGYIGLRLVRDLLGRRGGGHDAHPQAAVVSDARWSSRAVAYSFGGRRYSASLLRLLPLTLIVGLVGGIYGIGGGALMAPLLVSLFRLPVYTVAGATLLATFVTSLGAVALFDLLAPGYPHLAVAPDWRLGLLFGIGGLAGTYLGARCQRRVPEPVIKWMLSAVILYTALRYLFA